jgi:hypothetical protein
MRNRTLHPELALLLLAFHVNSVGGSDQIDYGSRVYLR